MKIYFAGYGHNIEKTIFIDKMVKHNFLLSYAGLNQSRFLWAVRKKDKNAKIKNNYIDQEE